MLSETGNHVEPSGVCCKLPQSEKQEDELSEIEVQDTSTPGLLYGVEDIPPLVVSIPVALQICIQTLSTAITFCVLTAKAICAPDLVAARIMNTSVFLAGLTTLLQTTIGIRLPIYQGPSVLYVMPILARAALPDWKCPHYAIGNGTVLQNMTNISAADALVSWDHRLAEISGSLMAVSLIHAVLGYTGLVGYIVRSIGPLTIAPALLLIGLDVVIVLRDFAIMSWPVAGTTLTSGTQMTNITSALLHDVLCGSYLLWLSGPGPGPRAVMEPQTKTSPQAGPSFPTFWSRASIFETFLFCSILRIKTLVHWTYYAPSSAFFRYYKYYDNGKMIFGMTFGWLLSYILTEAGYFSEDPNAIDFQARTDSKGDVIQMATWFYVPYPGQFGPPSFSVGLFFGLMIAMVTSVLDSVADYIVASNVCRIQKPPPHAVNRGLFVEGLCSILSGAFGAGHATTTYSGIIGNLSLTGIASRRVFQFVGILLLFIGIFGKFAAFFVTMPKPVVGGFAAVGIASMIGMALSSLEEVDLSLPRNVISLGLPLVIGTAIPSWVKENPQALDTGINELNQLLSALLTNSMFVGGIMGFLLDNTLPGNRKKASSDPTSTDSEPGGRGRGSTSVYEIPYVGRYFRGKKWTRFVPIIPHGHKHAKATPE